METRSKASRVTFAPSPDKVGLRTGDVLNKLKTPLPLGTKCSTYQYSPGRRGPSPTRGEQRLALARKTADELQEEVQQMANSTQFCSKKAIGSLQAPSTVGCPAVVEGSQPQLGEPGITLENNSKPLTIYKWLEHSKAREELSCDVGRDSLLVC
jgi:hypothetical protein